MNRTLIAIVVIATAACASVTCAGLADADFDAKEVGSFHYHMTRNDVRVGEISVVEQITGRMITICSTTSVQIKAFGFLSLYKSSSSDEERWSDGSLIFLSSKSVIKGVMHELIGKVAESRFSLRLDNQNFDAPTSLGTTLFWRRTDITKAALLDPVTGQLMANPEQKDLGLERTVYKGREVDLHHYRLVGSLERDIWYDGDRLFRFTYKALDGSVVAVEAD